MDRKYESDYVSPGQRESERIMQEYERARTLSRESVANYRFMLETHERITAIELRLQSSRQSREIISRAIDEADVKGLRSVVSHLSDALERVRVNLYEASSIKTVEDMAEALLGISEDCHRANHPEAIQRAHQMGILKP